MTQVVKLRARRFLVSVAATALMALIALGVGVIGLLDGEVAGAVLTLPIAIVLGVVAVRMLNHAYVIDGTTISYRNGVFGRVTRSVDLLDVVLVTLVQLGKRKRSRITLWAAPGGEPRWRDRVGRLWAGSGAIVRETEARHGRLRAMPVDLDLVGGGNQEPIWVAMDAAGLPVEDTHSFPIIRN